MRDVDDSFRKQKEIESALEKFVRSDSNAVSDRCNRGAFVVFECRLMWSDAAVHRDEQSIEVINSEGKRKTLFVK